MTASLTLYTHPMSRGRTARWMLEECGATYNTVILDYGTSMKAPDYLAINPMGKVPALRHGDTVITETAAICAYLADLFPEKNLAPAVGTQARGVYYRWWFFMAGPMSEAVTGKHLGLLAPPEKAMKVGYGRYENVINTLEGVLSKGPYLCGAQFTAADLYLAAYLDWSMPTGAVEKLPVFERYTRAIVQRPSYLRASAIDDALIAKHPFPG